MGYKSIFVNLRYLGFKLLKYKENKKICNTFDQNFKNIPLYIMRKVSLKRYYFVLYDGALTLKMSRMALNPFCDKIFISFHCPASHTFLLATILSLEKEIVSVTGKKMDKTYMERCTQLVAILTTALW